MSQNNSMATAPTRPTTHSSKSFTRFEPSQPTIIKGHRHRASTLESSLPSKLSVEQEQEDVFYRIPPETESPDTPDLSQSQNFPDKFDELPVELVSLTDRFIESLGTRAFEQPPSIEQISDLFQEFYVRASTSVAIHISTLITRLNRETSPGSSKTPARSKTLPVKATDNGSTGGNANGAQQMLTASEVTERRRARRMLEYKRLLLEEAVERRVCEKVYRKIWRHKSTLDEVEDEKLRSKTAALALVGIGLKDLGIELDQKSGRSLEDVQELLIPARDDLMRMNQETCPLGKLQHLTKAHKTIVDTLYAIHGSSSSADEILPTLIYTLITAPVEGINIISNLNFIQRFRTASKIDGEAAYCMTNLEAAISFLENVDLSTLRADEFPEGPRKTPSQPGTPVKEKGDPFPTLPTTSVATTSTTATSSPGTPEAATKVKTSLAPAKSLPSPRHQRTLSDLLQPVAAANEAVRLKANEGIENIANTLDNSFKFLFGRLKEKAADPASPRDMIVPKTLDEALQLVSKSPVLDEHTVSISETSSLADRELVEGPTLDKGDKILSLFGGKKAGSMRDRSVDSQKSNASSRRVTFGASTGIPVDTLSASEEPAPSQVVQSTPLDSVKTIGSSLNPFANFGAFGGGFGRFGRPSAAPAASPPVTAGSSKKEDPSDVISGVGGQTALHTGSSAAVASRIRSVDPPIRKFLQMEDASEMKVKEVADLLKDYKRLAALLGELAS